MTIKSNQKVTIDLNGHILSLTATKTSTTYLFLNKGDLIIKDSRDIQNDSLGEFVTAESIIPNDETLYAT